MKPNITIRRAHPDDLLGLATLFDLYRQFYECPADLDAAAKWLQQNMEAQRSVIFTADTGSELLGFTQLYPALSSTLCSMTSTYSRVRVGKVLQEH